jgi:DNA ligase (NAD+)
MNILDEAKQLELDITELNGKYERNEPCKLDRLNRIVTDPEFDRMVDRLKFLKPDSDVLTNITGAIGEDLPNVPKVTHNPPMASINKAVGKLEKKQAELNKWMIDRLVELTDNGKVIKLPVCNAAKKGYQFDKVALPHLCLAKYSDDSPVFVTSLKHDGVACRIYYENGILKSAGLRPRNGVVAPDIIKHIQNISNIPQNLPIPATCAIGGELEILISNFEKVNNNQRKNGEDEYANPRNAAAGAMNPLGDPKEAKNRMVSFVAHSIENYDKPPYKTARDRAIFCNKVLKQPFVRVEPLDFDKLAELEQLVKDLDYETDGIVIEVNNLEDAEQMGRHGGSINGNPKAKIAWKFAEQQVAVIVKSLDWQVGRGGRHVAVAQFDGVKLAGTTVSRCTLHNLGFMQRKGIGVGAKILIEKSGKIIPKAVDVLVKSKVEHPINCLSCGHKLSIVQGESHDEDGNKIVTSDLICENSNNCPAQNEGNLIHYLATFGVKGVAERDVTAGIKSGKLKNVSNFYELTLADFIKGGLSDRQATLAYARIHMIERADQEPDNAKLFAIASKAAKNKKSIPLAQLIACLGINGASKGTGRELAAHFGTIDNILNASLDDFLKVSNIGQTTAENLVTYFKENKDVIINLLKYVEPELPKSGKFSGKSFVFTGTFSKPREQMQKMVEDLGGKSSSSVSKNTDYVVFGPEAGSKYDKAVDLKSKGANIQIIDEKQFLTLV